MTPITIFLCFLYILHIVCYTIYKRVWKMTVLERYKIPGPKPHIISGNMNDYNQTSNVLWDSDLTARYGPICGYYLGAKPFVLISDPELLYQIQHKHSSEFLDRPRRVPGGINPDPKRALMLGNLSVHGWQHMRHLINPTFNTLNIKGILHKIVTLSDKFLAKVHMAAESKTETDFYALFQALTLDIIGTTAFGLDSNIQDNPDDPLLKAVKAEFAKTTNSTMVKFYLCFPELSWILHPFRKMCESFRTFIWGSESSALWNHGRAALARRRNLIAQGLYDGESNDLLQQLVKSAELTDDQIVANSVLFFEAAYETLSACLGFITHLLVNHPDVQYKVRAELENFVQENGSLETYDIMGGQKYLDNVINEGLRLFPPQTTFIGRSPVQDFKYTKDSQDYVLPAGIHIQVALFQIHNSSELWGSDSKEFRPERFEINNRQDIMDKLTFQPFGFGPRHCIGSKFAKLVLKLVLARLLHNFELVPSTKTEQKVTIQYKVATMTPKHGSWALPIPTGL